MKKLMQQKHQTQVRIKVRIHMVLPLQPKHKKDIHHLAVNKIKKEIKEYMNSLFINMFSPWERKLLMDVFILTEHQQKYDIIKHVNKDCVHNIYPDPKKYPVCNKFKGDGYSL